MIPVERYDVAVIGLGPAGACAAAQAAVRGCRVLAMDRKREPGRPVQCAEFVPAMAGAEARRCANAVQQSIRAMMTFIEDSAPDSRADFAGYMLDRAAFDVALVDAAARAGAHCLPGTAVRSISPYGELGLADGRRVAAAVIIGADGPRSVAGRRIGQVNRELIETRQITVPLHQRHEATDIFLSAGIPGGYGWLFPKNELAHVGAGVDAAHRERLKGIVARLHATLVESGRVGATVVARTGGAIPAGGMLVPHGALGETLVLLAGDAAGLTNPVTGAGIPAAVYSGQLAGEAAADQVAGNRKAGAQYEEELRGVLGPALERAVARRRELAGRRGARSRPARSDWRRGWIAYPEYWTSTPLPEQGTAP